MIPGGMEPRHRRIDFVNLFIQQNITDLALGFAFLATNCDAIKLRQQIQKFEPYFAKII